jgi:hypothetical protein
MTGALPFTAIIYCAVCLAWTKATLNLANTMEEVESEKKVRGSCCRGTSGWVLLPGTAGLAGAQRALIGVGGAQVWQD